jgi:DNA-binding response OmpR family regulator
MPQKILVIDDEIDVLKLLKFRLERAGYQVITALDGIKGLELALHEHPDLVILDIMMPGGDGYAVCEKFKSSSATATLPVIFLSAKTEEKDVIKGYSTGAIFYLKKPYDPAVLLETVDKALRAPQELERERKKKIKNFLILTQDPILTRLIRDNFSSSLELNFIQGQEGLKSLPDFSGADVILLDLTSTEFSGESWLQINSSIKEETMLILIVESLKAGLAEEISSQSNSRCEILQRPFEIDSLKLLLREVIRK